MGSLSLSHSKAGWAYKRIRPREAPGSCHLKMLNQEHGYRQPAWICENWMHDERTLGSQTEEPEAQCLLITTMWDCQEWLGMKIVPFAAPMHTLTLVPAWSINDETCCTHAKISCWGYRSFAHSGSKSPARVWLYFAGDTLSTATGAIHTTRSVAC